MHQPELITDLLYEIFRDFVAVDPDGPFTLMLVCTAWQDLVLNHPPIWSRVHMDPDVGDLEARMAACTTLSARQPLYLHLYMPYPPSFIGFIRPHVHRIHGVVVHMPMDLKMDEAVRHVSKMVRDLRLDRLPFRFLRGEEDVFYSPANMDEILEKHSLDQPFDSPICPSNMITALTLSTRGSRRSKLSLQALLTWLSLNILLVHLEIHTSQFTMEAKEALPIVSLPSLRALIIHQSLMQPGTIFLRHIQSPNSIAITLSGPSNSLFAAISEIRVGLRPSAMTLFFKGGILGWPAERSETIKMALSSVRYLHLHFPVEPLEAAQILGLAPCLPRSAVLRITTVPYNELASEFDHPPHLIQLEYPQYPIYHHLEPTNLSSIPTWCRDTHPFNSLSLEERDVGLIASCCKKLFLTGVRTSTSFLNSQINLQIEELKCDSEVHGEMKPFPPKVGELNNLSKLTCTLSFALALLQQRGLPMLRELILINGPEPTYNEFRDKWESFSSLLTKTSRTRTPMRLLSIPVWTPWVPLFKIAKLLSRGNQDGIIPTLVLPSLPHHRILAPIVDSLNGKLVTQTNDLPSWKSPETCSVEDICYECHNGGWWCTDVQPCRRGQRGEPTSITRYTLSNL